MSGKDGIKDFIREVSGGDPAAQAANARILAGFRSAGTAPAGAKERVLASLSKRPVLPKGGLAPAFALLALAAGAFLLLGPRAEPEPLLAPDWLSYENFPYYSDEARMYLEPVSYEGQTLEGLIPSAEKGPAAL